MRNPFRRQKAISATPAVLETMTDRRANLIVGLGGTNNQQIQAAWLRGQQATYGWFYANTPAVRAVVDFMARNVAQLGLKLYERVADDERKRDEDHPAALTMKSPGARVPGDQFICRLVTDYLVYNNAYGVKFRPSNSGPLQVIRFPPERVAVMGGGFVATGYRFWLTDGSFFDAPPEDVIHWHGYNPADPLLGLSPLETLRSTITEDNVSQATTVELMRNGLKSGYIARPLEAPEWSLEARTRFQEDMRNQRAAAPRLDPVLEEGMEWKSVGVSPKDAELLSGRRFTVEEVCRVYGIPPEVVGLILTGGDLPEARKQVYTDVLPPLTETLAGQLDQDVLVQEYGERDYYFEFDLNEKLRGDPVQRFAAITSAVGAPWLLRDEARALENLPKIEGGDELITPLNVVVGDNPKPAPNVMGPQNALGPPQDGSHRETPKALGMAHGTHLVAHRKADLTRQRRHIDEATGMMERYYSRLGRAVRSVEGRKARFDFEAWDSKLSGEIEALVKSIVEREGGHYAARLGGSDFDMRQVEHYLQALAQGAAEAINDVTRKDITENGVDDAITRGRRERAGVAGASLGARSTIFARLEAAKQSPSYELRRKTWVADTQRHAEVDGETVPVDGDFSIGFGPGSAPNCACTLSIS